MLDVTWEAPDGSITPLDGYLDPYFQEIYLEAESVPIFSKLAKHVSSNALDEYVAQLEKEVSKYLTKDINYGKAAKRMYNVFRLTGKYEEAAFLRELFDEPTTLLYQVWSLIRTIDDCFTPGSSIPLEQVLAQADHLVIAVVRVLEGEKEEEIVRLLLRLRDSLSRQQSGEQQRRAEAARAEVINLVNNFFYQRLTALPTIKTIWTDSGRALTLIIRADPYQGRPRTSISWGYSTVKSNRTWRFSFGARFISQASRFSSLCSDGCGVALSSLTLISSCLPTGSWSCRNTSAA
jgi:hypothetical protein